MKGWNHGDVGANINWPYELQKPRRCGILSNLLVLSLDACHSGSISGLLRVDFMAPSLNSVMSLTEGTEGQGCLIFLAFFIAHLLFSVWACFSYTWTQLLCLFSWRLDSVLLSESLLLLMWYNKITYIWSLSSCPDTEFLKLLEFQWLEYLCMLMR